MRELNLEYETDINGSYLSLKVGSESDLDKISYLVMQQDCPDFIIPIKKSVSNGMVQLKFQMSMNWTALKYTVNSSVTKNQFIKLMLSLINPILHGSDWFLKASNYVMDPENIYVDKNTSDVHFVYIPLKEDIVSPEEILNFIKQYSFGLEISDDPKFQVAWMRLFEGGMANLVAIEAFLNQEQAVESPVKAKPVSAPVEPKKVVSTPEKSTEPARVEKPVETPVAVTAVVEEKVEEPVKQEVSTYDVLFGKAKPEKKKKLFQREEKVNQQKEKQPKEKKSLFGKKKDAQFTPVDSIPAPNSTPAYEPVEPQVEEIEVAAPAVEPEVEYEMPDLTSNDTLVYDDAVAITSRYLQLISSPVDGAPERISLDFEKPFVTIGRVSKDMPDPDVAFSSAFRGIGRKHAIIERDGDVYFIVDQGSSNRTLLNGEQLIPNKKYQLNNDDVISFTVMMPVKYRVCLG